MKKHLLTLILLPSLALLLQGCIAFPPLIQVEHKDSPNNQDIIRRLDSIDQRLAALEQKQK